MNPVHIKQIDFKEMIKNKLTFKRPLPQPIYIEYDPLKDFSNQTNKLLEHVAIVYDLLFFNLILKIIKFLFLNRECT